jgi:hypothetical protein
MVMFWLLSYSFFYNLFFKITTKLDTKLVYGIPLFVGQGIPFVQQFDC